MEQKQLPCLELRRFETIYRTFVKMTDDERKRSLEFMISRFNQDLTKKQNEKIKTTKTRKRNKV